MFQNLDLKKVYCTSDDDLVNDFFVPALSNAVSYDRAVGYFNACALALYSRGLETLLSEQGRKMRLIVSPQLSKRDIEDIALGYEEKGVLERRLESDLQPENPHIEARLGLVGLLIKTGYIEIKVAISKSENEIGSYHEKVGLLTDSSGDSLAFSGSLNETCRAFSANYESIMVFRKNSSSEDAGRVSWVADHFERLWENRIDGIQVIEFPDLPKAKLIEISDAFEGDYLDPSNPFNASFGLLGSETLKKPHIQAPAGFSLRDYQLEALTKWEQNGRSGVLELATGTGKTSIALAAIEKLSAEYRNSGKSLCVVVLAPLKQLVVQWIDEFSNWSCNAIHISSENSGWRHEVDSYLLNATTVRPSLLVLVSTYNTWAQQQGGGLVDKLTGSPVDLMIVGDEVHNFGTSEHQKIGLMNPTTIARMGISATPERWKDPSGTKFIFDYFGKRVCQYTLAQAISDGWLSTYDYYPRLVELSDDDMDELVKIISQRKRPAFEQIIDDVGDWLSRPLAKFPMFQVDLLENRSESFQIVFSPPGSPKRLEKSGRGEKYIETVTHIAGNNLGIPCRAITSSVEPADRIALLRSYVSEEIRLLAAIRILDEGINIPEAKWAYFLDSSENPKQFVQRRGRLLRKSPTKDKAIIFDYVAIPQRRTGVDLKVTRPQLEADLARLEAFAESASNEAEVSVVLDNLKEIISELGES